MTLMNFSICKETWFLIFPIRAYLIKSGTAIYSERTKKPGGRNCPLSIFNYQLLIMNKDYSEVLKKLMHKVSISSYKQLSKQAKISDNQIKKLRQGDLTKMQLKTLLKISQSLQISLSELLDKFGYPSDIESLKQEYQHLQMLLIQQEKTLLQQFQQDSLQVLESFLIYFPTAVNKSQENPQLEAKKIIPLVKPVEELIKKWGIEAIASVGAEISYDPQWHELISGDCEVGDMVKVRYIGYKQGEKLLYRAKVSFDNC